MILPLGRGKQESEKFIVILSYAEVDLCSGDPLSQRKTGGGQSVNSKIQCVPRGDLHSDCASGTPPAGASLAIFMSGSFNKKKTHQECFRHSTISEQQNLRNLMGAGASMAGMSDLWASEEPLPEGG